MNRLSDRVAIVTGGAMGIGGATARRLAAEGDRVLVVDVNADAVVRNVATISGQGGVAEALVSDVGTEAGVRAMIDQAVSKWGKLDIVVNNAYAGIGGPKVDAVNETEASWDRSMDIGLKSMFRAARYAVPHMRAAGGGSMVNLSSVHGLLGAPGALVYETLQAGVIGLTRQLAVEYGPDRIRANAICPAHIPTARPTALWRERHGTLRLRAA